MILVSLLKGLYKQGICPSTVPYPGTGSLEVCPAIINTKKTKLNEVGEKCSADVSESISEASGGKNIEKCTEHVGGEYGRWYKKLPPLQGP